MAWQLPTGTAYHIQGRDSGNVHDAKLVHKELHATMAMLGVDSQAAIKAMHNTKGNPGHYLIDTSTNKLKLLRFNTNS
jgi:hypothetical protein